MRCEARQAGEYSVTAENSLGSSTRDWRLRVRPVEVVPRVTPSQVPVPETSEKIEIKSSNTKELCKQFEDSQSLAINNVSRKKRDYKEDSPPASHSRGESKLPGGGGPG